MIFYYIAQHSRHIIIIYAWSLLAVLPRGIMERYLPRNLLAMVISCHKVQPLWEITWCAAAGGWWLTWEDTETQRLCLTLCTVVCVCVCWITVRAHLEACKQNLSVAVPLPAHTASGSQIPPSDQARTFRPGGGWRAWLSGGPLLSRKRQRRQRPGTSVLVRSRSGLPCLEARDTPGPRWGAAASTEAH